MELHQLMYFEAVATQLHFTRAAQALHVAQPSVSQQIRKLEEELGAPLFHRLKRRVELTEAGRLLLPRARAVLRELAEGRAEVQELAALRRGTLSVGAPPSVGTHLLPRVLASFRRRYPGIALTFREAGSRTLVERLVDGELDLAVVIPSSPHPALETMPLLEERLLLALPRDHRLARRSRIAVRELREEPFVMFREGVYELREQTLAACRRAGFEPRIALDGGEMDSVLRFVTAGLGVAILPESVLDGRDDATSPVAVPLSGPTLRRSLVIARRRDRTFSGAARVFAEQLRREAQGAAESGAAR
ncbi:MAG TPA: LysR substrate-binding domain-containing protein [Chloroflexota bacterium]|jgi:DNA-binding transcriptional LysR family regulator|nr:LysR substrate-binding domain-containing protein [Chloroflexota bacterium]